jgi:GT2 family glycosyltransferase
VVAVDNGSTDGSSVVLVNALGADRVISLEDNPGLPRSVQAAMRLDVAEQADYLLILHDDVVLEPETVTRLVETAERVGAVGVVGPKIVDWQDPRRLQDVGGSTDRFGYPYSPLEEEEMDQGQYDRTREVLFVSSCAMLVSRAAVHRAGPPDERLACSQDDLDFCWRVRLAGFRVVIDPAAVARHRRATTRGERPGHAPRGSLYLTERATLAAMLKNFSWLSLLWLFPLYLVQGAAKLVGWALARRFDDVWQLLTAWGWNLLHLPGTIRRRARAQSVRRIPDRALRRYMAPLTLRVRRWLDAARGAVGSEDATTAEERPIEEQEELELPSIGARTVGFARAHPVATTWIFVAILAAFAYRPLVGSGPVQGGAAAAFPATAGGFFHELVSGVRTTGLGGTDAASPALALLGAISWLLFGSPELAQKALLILLPPLAGLAFYRAMARRSAHRVAALAGGLTYALSPLTLWAFSQGRIPVLVMLAALPPIAARLQAGFGTPSPARRRLRLSAEAGVVVALAVAFWPGALLAVVLLVAGHAVFPAIDQDRRRGLGVAGGAVVIAAALLFPLVISVVGEGGAPLRSLVGVASFSQLARLAPEAGPGSWWVAWFLPGAALAGFVLLEAGARRAAWRSMMVVIVGLYLAWLSAAGYLPAQLTNAPAYLAATALSYCTMLARGIASMSGFERRAFSYRHIAAGAAGALAVVGLVIQAGVAGVADWQIGRDNLPPAWPLVSRADPGEAFRVLWLSQRAGVPLPAPGGDPQGAVRVADTSIRYSLTGRGGQTALDVGRTDRGDGYGYLERVLGAALSGTTSHVGAMLGPLSIRYIVAAKGDLAPSVLYRLNGQADLDLIRAGGLTIFRNERFMPVAWSTTDQATIHAVRGGSLLDVASLDGGTVRPAHRVPGGVAGPLQGTGPAEMVLAEQFSSGWRLRSGSAGAPGRPTASVSPDRAFGWATGFIVPPGASRVRIEYGRQWVRSIEMWIVLVLWVAALWVTRAPAGSPRPGSRRPGPAIVSLEEARA